MERRKFLVVSGGVTGALAGCVSETPVEENTESEEEESADRDNADQESRDGNSETTGFGDSFRAESQGGLVSLGSMTEAEAKEDGIRPPEKVDGNKYIVVEGEITDGQWESTLVEFPRERTLA